MPELHAEEAAPALLEMANLLRPSAIRAAATLRLADFIAEGGIGIEELAKKAGADPAVLAILMRYLIALKLFDIDTQGILTVTALGSPLRDDDAKSIRALLDTDGVMGFADTGLVNILHTVRTGEPAHAAMAGGDYWKSVNRDPIFIGSLEQFCSSVIGWDAHLLVERYDWSKIRSFVDVGGNGGALLIELLRRYPHLNGIVVDLPNTAAIAAARIAASDVAERGAAVAGDFFEPLPSGADTYVLSAILADWNDAKAVQILKRCAEAAGPSGAILLGEVNLHQVGDSTDAALAGADLYVRALVETPVRTTADLTRLAEAAGLKVTWAAQGTTVRTVLELRPR